MNKEKEIEICLLNKEYISCPECERTNMLADYKVVKNAVKTSCQ